MTVFLVAAALCVWPDICLLVNDTVCGSTPFGVWNGGLVWYHLQVFVKIIFVFLKGRGTIWCWRNVILILLCFCETQVFGKRVK